MPLMPTQANNDSKGTPLPWGQVPWEQLYGPNGWCNSDTPVIRCVGNPV